MMTLEQALAPLLPLPDHQLVITTMSVVGAWPADDERPLLFHYMPSSMGQGSSLGLGLALAQPKRRVTVLNGDGCMLMNLGSLVTIGQCRPSNLSLIVLDNGIYEITGGQPHAGSGRVDFVRLAEAAGIETVCEFTDPTGWEQDAPTLLTAPGPVFVRLEIEPRYGQAVPKPSLTMAEQIHRLRVALSVIP